MKIVLLDDGLTWNKLKIDFNVKEYVVDCGKVLPYQSSQGKHDSHGLICAKIITRNMSSDDMLFSYKIKQDNYTLGSIYDLGDAFLHCLNLDVNIIHLSVGSRFNGDRKYFQYLCNQAERKKVCVIAALCNDNTVTYPASLKNVIGVKHNLRGIEERILYHKYSTIGINVETCPPIWIPDNCNNKFFVPLSNSFAAASISYQVVNGYKSSDMDNKKLKNFLKEQAFYVY